jgi:hypothetical protein
VAAVAGRLARPNHGRLVAGWSCRRPGRLFVTVDPVTGTSPNRAWRRTARERLLRMLLAVAEEHAAAHPGAARLVIGDLSRPRGRRFGRRVRRGRAPLPPERARRRRLLPRRDGLERVPPGSARSTGGSPQELVDRFVRAGAQYVFVGPRTGLRGPPKVVMTLANHDDHLHVRIRPGPGPPGRPAGPAGGR